MQVFYALDKCHCNSIRILASHQNEPYHSIPSMPLLWHLYPLLAKCQTGQGNWICLTNFCFGGAIFRQIHSSVYPTRRVLVPKHSNLQITEKKIYGSAVTRGQRDPQTYVLGKGGGGKEKGREMGLDKRKRQQQTKEKKKKNNLIYYI